MFDAVYCNLLTLLGPFASFSGTLAKNDVYNYNKRGTEQGRLSFVGLLQVGGAY